MKPDITICAAADLVGIIRTTSHPFDAVISFERPGAKHAARAPRLADETGDPSWATRQLILTCVDVERMMKGGPKPSHLQAAFDHLDRHKVSTRPTRLLLHCHFGRSRSTATALAILRRYYGPGSEQASFDEVLRLRPVAMPNLLITRYADEALGCDEALLKVVRRSRRIEARIRHASTNCYERFVRPVTHFRSSLSLPADEQFLKPWEA